MKEKILVFCDDDKTYIDRLGRYINSRKSRDLSVACFSDRDKLAEYAKENQVDLFLAGESWIDEKLCGDMRRWIELSESRTEEGHSYRCIYRYQPADEMLEKVLQPMKRLLRTEKHRSSGSDSYGRSGSSSSSCIYQWGI